MNLKHWIKKSFPPKLVYVLRLIQHPSLVKNVYHIYRLRWCYRKHVRRLRIQERVNVAFYVFLDSTWKCEELYKLLILSPHYNPFVVVCPVVNYGKENMISQMEKTKAYFEKKGYKTITTYDSESDSYLDVENLLCPDVIFYTNPYNELTHEKYKIYNIKNALTCYVPYFYLASADPKFFDLDFHKMLWAYFIESPCHLAWFKQYGKSTKNCFPVGYAVFDEFEKIESEYECPKSEYRTTILWSPHHTITDDSILKQSGFLELADFFIRLSKDSSLNLKIIFRPHPILKQNLYLHPDWGKERTDEYYNYWTTIPNGELSDGGSYIEDFLKSDILIHDCGSFMSEYLYTLKPAIYYSREEKYYPQLNSIGKEAFNAHYIAYTSDELEEFVYSLIGGTDPKYVQRVQFKEKYLKFDTSSSSQRILEFLNIQLKK